jgi:ABC-type arginine/histidine transport system permease subunit
MVIYMRAHREEPMLTQSIVIGLMIALMIYFCGQTSVLMMMSGYMMMTLFIGLPWTVWLFLKYKTRSI